MGLDLSILYRGVLSGCNYDCGYCPFAKRVDDKATLQKDAQDLDRFVNWVKSRSGDSLRILFTPWGEALIRKYYQSALCELSHLPQIKAVSIQTNLSCSLSWAKNLNPKTASLWCTYHPDQVTLDKFLQQCQKLDMLEILYSVGCVGKHELMDDIEILRKELSDDIYVWVNAFKDNGADYYQNSHIEFLEHIDPLFRANLNNYTSLGQACRAGYQSISVDGKGDVRRCHFISDVIGNIYETQLESILKPRLCTRDICDCHIGYSNIAELDLDRHYKGNWALGRVR
ncbi:MAG: STM4011 family radical SAM protein [Hellea sp.]